MHANETLIQKFYQAFQERNAQTMGDSYSDDAHFSDPVFPDLNGKEIYGMWAMLLEGMDPEGKISCSNVVADDAKGSADWEAIYKFSKTGRTIHNKIHAEFQFSNGKIVNHKDDFSFFKWARMAFGFKGLLLGWTPLLKNKVRDEVSKTLKMYMKRRRIK
ncbi:MAG: nuclear transport factor 2 family protein [Leptospira sp.]|nr:nuclear transport factor 2 family protein [Leptospira sp.]